MPSIWIPPPCQQDMLVTCIFKDDFKLIKVSISWSNQLVDDTMTPKKVNNRSLIYIRSPNWFYCIKLILCIIIVFVQINSSHIRSNSYPKMNLLRPIFTSNWPKYPNRISYTSPRLEDRGINDTANMDPIPS